MQNETMSREQIEERVTQALVQALGVSPSEVRPDASLVTDLEAESIDFLDIVFRLEKEFGIEISRGELFPQDLLRDPALVANGRLTAAGVAEIKKGFPFADLSRLQPGTSVDDVMTELVTVNLLVDYVSSKLQSAPTATRA
jgi:acyl carrier protein